MKKCGHDCCKFDTDNILNCCLCTNDTVTCKLCLERVGRMSDKITADEIMKYITDHLTEFPKHKITIEYIPDMDKLDINCSCHYIREMS